MLTGYGCGVDLNLSIVHIAVLAYCKQYAKEVDNLLLKYCRKGIVADGGIRCALRYADRIGAGLRRGPARLQRYSQTSQPGTIAPLLGVRQVINRLIVWRLT